jgi:hypothetical protein
VNEANLAIARKVVLYVGLLVAALLFLFPKWRMTMMMGETESIAMETDRSFIADPPFIVIHGELKTVARVNHARQFAEVASGGNEEGQSEEDWYEAWK